MLRSEGLKGAIIYYDGQVGSGATFMTHMV